MLIKDWNFKAQFSPPPTLATLNQLPNLHSPVQTDKWCSRLHSWKAIFALSYFRFSSCFRSLRQTLFACLGLGKRWGYFFLQFNARGFLLVNESESARSWSYFIFKGWTGSWCGGGGGIGKLEEPVLTFCLFILRSQQDSCPRRPPTPTFFGGWFRLYFLLSTHWSFSFNVLQTNKQEKKKKSPHLWLSLLQFKTPSNSHLEIMHHSPPPFPFIVSHNLKSIITWKMCRSQFRLVFTLVVVFSLVEVCIQHTVVLYTF